MVPRQSGETFKPDFPKCLYSNIDPTKFCLISCIDHTNKFKDQLISFALYVVIEVSKNLITLLSQVDQPINFRLALAEGANK
tara:strand:+ start:101 stop:346 length:246 start_codon:yes stop_codon:yes gene_type:complete